MAQLLHLKITKTLLIYNYFPFGSHLCGFPLTESHKLFKPPPRMSLMNTLAILLPSELNTNQNHSYDALFHTLFSAPAMPFKVIIFPFFPHFNGWW